MSNTLISFLIAVGASAWIFQKLQKSSGNNTRQSLIATAIIGVIIFIVVLVILGMVIND